MDQSAGFLGKHIVCFAPISWECTVPIRIEIQCLCMQLHQTPGCRNAFKTLKTEAKYLLRNQLSSKAKTNLSYRGNESQMRRALRLRYSELRDATWGAKGDT